MSNIRNISQTVQEREIIKTAPDMVVYLDGLPYLFNWFIDDPNTNNNYTLVNFNDHVTSFGANYDTDIMIPSATITLQVPNFQKHLYVMPGGNNLIQPMTEVQAFAKGYYFAANGDTVYRRVFKGLISKVGYADNGKTLEISLQCLGTMHFLELMQINLSPAVQTAVAAGVSPVIWESIFASQNPYEILASLITEGLDSLGFQQNNLGQTSPLEVSSKYYGAVKNGYIAKWQAILVNMAKDVHIFGTSFKDDLKKNNTKPSDVKDSLSLNQKAAAVTSMRTTPESDTTEDSYFMQIRKYLPDMKISDVSLLNNKIISRLEYVRHVLHMIAFEGYQDIDGKIIIKPPLYNLDVVELGQKDQKTSPTGSGDFSSSLSNPLTEIHDQTNPFVIYLSEIITENETEDEVAIRKTRMTCSGNINPGFHVDYINEALGVGEWIDIAKLQKFGLREEPVVQIPWINADAKYTLASHAAAETVRANKGYRTYTVTIPIRPELKLGFPIYFPHKDMYAYIKNINIAYQVGGNATMTVVCDSVRRRIMIPYPAKTTSGVDYTRYKPASDLIHKWGKNASNNSNNPSGPDPNQSPGNNMQFAANPIGQPSTLSATKDVQLSTDGNILQTLRQKRLASSWEMQPDTTDGSYIVAVDTDLFVKPKSVDDNYFKVVWEGNIPFTDGKGYEVMAPFPWGRYQNLNAAIKQFTMDGYIVQPTDLNGQPISSIHDTDTLKTIDAFLFAGLGNPSAAGNPSQQLTTVFAQMQNRSDMDTIIVLDYSGSSSNDSLLKTAQPDISNSLVTSLLESTTNSNQQLISVLVSGAVSPINTPRQTAQALIIQTSPGLPKKGVPTAPQFVNQDPADLSSWRSGVGATTTQNSKTQTQFASNIVSNVSGNTVVTSVINPKFGDGMNTTTSGSGPK